MPGLWAGKGTEILPEAEKIREVFGFLLKVYSG
jgi:hypothetical protein